MTKAVYPYPDDEFDAPADPGGPHGVHRAPRSAWRRWWPYVAMIIVLPLLAYGMVSYFDKSGSLTGGSGSSVAATDAGTDDTTDDSTDATSPGATTGPTTPAPTPTSTAAGNVFLATPVTVTNAAGIVGLAASAVTKLKDAGFTSVTSGNGSKGSLTASTVYYGSDTLVATAKKIAATLGLKVVEKSPVKAGSGITVVLLTKLPG